MTVGGWRPYVRTTPAHGLFASDRDDRVIVHHNFRPA